MNRRDVLETGAISVFAGTALSTSAAAFQDRDRNRTGDWDSIRDRLRDDDSDDSVLNNDTDAEVVAFETESGNNDENEYTITYDDETVTITGNLVVPTPCDELVIENIVPTDYGDVVEFALKRDQSGCIQVAAGASFSVTLEYESTSDVHDVLVSTPESGFDGIILDSGE